MKLRLLLLLSGLGVLGPGAFAQSPPGSALVWLEVSLPSAAHLVPAAAPPRFALLADGRVFVGGTSAVLSGKLTNDEVHTLERELDLVRKLPGLDQPVNFGGAGPRHRLRVLKGKPLDVEATGDPTQAPAPWRPLAELVRQLAGFHHPSLRPWAPNVLGILAREEALPGGCRRWTLPVSPQEARAGHRVVPADAVDSWPKGGTPASVCAAGKAYVVALKPLLPDEQP
jgi:hypothetical protein